MNTKCGNHGGYSSEMRNVVCGLNPQKCCAGYDPKCGSFAYVNPQKKVYDVERSI